MELTQINKLIYDATERMKALENRIEEYSSQRAELEEKYDIALAREEARLIDEGKPITLAKDIAKGNISKEKKAYNHAEYMFEGLKLKEKAIEAQISGLQTIAKYQGEV